VAIRRFDHARHHLCLYDERSRSCFTGDTFGLSYREFDTANGPYAMPTTTPVQFDPAALHASIERLLALQPQAAYLTHYGRVGDLARLAAGLHEQIEAMVAIAREAKDRADRHAYLKERLAALYAQRVRAHGWRGSDAELDALLGMDVELNAQGLEVWLDRPPR